MERYGLENPGKGFETMYDTPEVLHVVHETVLNSQSLRY